MNILAIDAATAVLSLTLSKEDYYFEYNADKGFRHSELIMPGVDRLFAEAEMKPSELDLVCTALGPGSFTGLRVGMATAKGICAGTGAPLVAVPTLDVLADRFTLFDGLIVPVIDARKKRFFSALYRGENRLTEYGDWEPEWILRQIEELAEKGETIIFTGPDCDMFRGFLPAGDGNGRFRFDHDCRRGNGRTLISLGKKLFEKRGPDSMDTGPLYMRKSEAELSLEAKKQK